MNEPEPTATGRDAASQTATSEAAAKKPSELKIRLLLVLFSLLLTLIFGELALRLVLPSPAAPAGEATDDGFEFFTYDETLGWDLVPDTEDRHRSSEFDVSIRINAQGLRSDRELALEPSPDTKRVVVIGDSFSFGHGVEASEAFPALLDEQLEAVEVINLAVTGYGTDQQLLRLIEQGLDWRPDVVLLALFEGNVFRNVREHYLGYPKPRFELDGDALELVNVPVPRSAPDPGPLSRSRLWQLFGERGRDLLEHLGYGEAWPVTDAILARLDEVCRQADARLVVVVIAKDQAVYGSGLRRALHHRTLAEIDRMLERQKIPHLDLTPDLVEHASRPDADPLYFAEDGHWTAAAHRLAARQIAAWLTKTWNFSSD